MAWANTFDGFYAGGPDLLTYGSWFDSQPTAEMKVQGVTIGQEYEIKLVVADTRGLADGRTIDFGLGSGSMQFWLR